MSQRAGTSVAAPVVILDSDEEEDEGPTDVTRRHSDSLLHHNYNSTSTAAKSHGDGSGEKKPDAPFSPPLKKSPTSSDGSLSPHPSSYVSWKAMRNHPRDSAVGAARMSPQSQVDEKNSALPLQKTLRQIQEECAEKTKRLLADAQHGKRALQEKSALFAESSSPFKDLKPLEASTGAGSQSIRINSYYTYHAKKTVDKKRIPIRSIRTQEDRVPKYRYYVHVDRSNLVSDSKQLDYIPFLDERLDEITAELHTSYGGRVKDPAAVREKEVEMQVAKHYPSILQHGQPDNAEFSIEFERVFGIPLQTILPQSSPTKGPRSSQKTDEAGNILSSYVDLGCLLCGVHQCDIHGEYENAEFKRFQLPLDAILLRREDRLSRQQLDKSRSSTDVPAYDDNAPCSITCFLKSPALPDSTKPWTAEEMAMLREMLRPLGDEHRAACIIAPCLMRNCNEVYYEIRLMGPTPELSSGRAVRDGQTLKWYDRRRQIITLRDDRDLDRKTETHLHHKRGQLRACSHEGLTCLQAGKELCSCLENNVMCEKFCICPDDCYMKFNGCACYGTYTCQRSSTCACKRLNRECDPDLCHRCGVRRAASRFVNDDIAQLITCCNCSIQQGAGKKTVVGTSSIEVPEVGPMYGLYLAEPAKKDDFVIEYVGEIISEEEGERRGIIYDAQKLSYMFNLNAECIVDATRMGNASRFINHSSKNANLQVRILLTNLEHRIGFFATRDIAVGTELLFNYGDSYTKKYGLRDLHKERSQRNATLKENSKRREGSKLKRQKKQRGHAGKKAAVDQDVEMIDADQESGDDSMDIYAGMSSTMLYVPSDSDDEDYRP